MKAGSVSYRFSLIVLFLLIVPQWVRAVPPPDFIFNIASQATHLLTVLGVFAVAVFGAAFRLLKLKWVAFRERKRFFFYFSSFVLFVLFSGFYVGIRYYQKQANNLWGKKSRVYSFPRAQVDPPMITHKEFTSILMDRKTPFIVLDARENVEWENGHLPGSLHVRFADLKAGKYLELPRDQNVYVICYSAMRGREVAAFLVARGIRAHYLENGVEGWVRNNGHWMGRLSLIETHKRDNERRLFTTQEIKQRLPKIVLVDCRESSVFLKSPFPGAINIPIIATPSHEMDKVFNQIPPKSDVVLVCDDKWSCFDAFVTGIELEKRGHNYLGRYPTPWEWTKSDGK